MQTPLECFLIGFLFGQVAGPERAVNFVKFFRTILFRKAVNGCFWTLRGLVEGTCFRNKKFIIEVTEKESLEKVLWKKVLKFDELILQII